MDTDTRKKPDIWNWIDDFEGDKVILITAMVLLVASVITVFSSTSLLALGKGDSRVSIMTTQTVMVGLGGLVILLIYLFGNSSLYRFIGKYSFLLSLGMLVILVFNLDLGFVRASSINGAMRVIVVFGLQLHVYEFVKLFMILYASWALNTYKEGGFRLTKRIAGLHPKLSFLATPLGEKGFYLYIPLATTIGLVMLGSNSSAIFIAAILVTLFVVGGIDVKDILVMGAAMGLVVGMLTLANSFGVIETNRADTARSRIMDDEKAKMDSLVYYRPGGGHYDVTKFQKFKDKLMQPVGAKLAIKEGGLFGKGVGRSDQKYVVPVIFSDYMFSFIIEETGVLGAVILIILYYSLLARGVNVAKHCPDYFDKVVVTGYSILITAQAFMHMLVNVHFPLIPQTGQTLPLLSHGSTSFLVFCAVLGIMLSLSRQSSLQKEENAGRDDTVAPLYEYNESDA